MSHTIPHPRLLLLALALGGFAIGITEFATMGLIPYIAAGLGISEPTAGHLISAYALGVVVGAPSIAVLAARMSRRTLLLCLMGAFALGHIATALADNYSSLLVWRFLSGLPHGAYFGVGALVAASLVPPAKRAQAVGMMMLGLTVACTIGVPLISWTGQAIGWRACFVIVAVLAVATTVSLAFFLPKQAMRSGGSSAIRELKALTNKQVWLTLLTGAIGFGGMFNNFSLNTPAGRMKPSGSRKDETRSLTTYSLKYIRSLRFSLLSDLSFLNARRAMFF